VASAASQEPASFEVRTKLWLVLTSRHGMGEGLAGLLDHVAQHGSLSEAARRSEISYRHAWDMIRDAERRLGRKLIHAQPGGTGGGSSSLSDEGRRLVDIFAQLDREVAAFASRRLAELLNER